MSVLENILQQKREEVETARSKRPLDELKRQAATIGPTRAFRDVLRGHGLSVIAEIKKASPSRGVLATEFDPVALAREFEQGGARALSVLTDKHFFQGQKSYIQAIKNVVSVPVLRKDFIIDEYQVYESRVIGADAILLIVRALSQEMLARLYQLAHTAGLDVLVETHSAEEIQRANEVRADIVGINNRDLSTFDVSLQRSIDLRPLVHSGAVTVSESGITSATDAAVIRKSGFDAILVGESLMTAGNRLDAMRLLSGG